jgi:glucose-1-phosphate thymidylyltransferase
MQTRTAVVLAAGEGRRLRPLTRHRPKPMLPAANRPILEYVLDALVDAGVEALHLVVGYGRDRVQSHFGPSYRDRPVTYHVQSRQGGSGHALLAAREAVDGPVIVANGDEVVTAETVTRVAEARRADDVASVAVVESEDAPSFGAVRVEDGLVTELVEKPGGGPYRLLNAGVYALDETVVERLAAAAPAAGELGLTDAIGALAGEGEPVRAARVEGLWVDATYPWDLPTLAAELLSDGLVDEPETTPGSGLFVDDAAVVHPDATLRPPVVVGPDVTVGPAAVVGPHVALGRNAAVAPGAVVDRTVVDADARVGPNATVLDSVLGQAARVGPGVTVPGGTTDVRVDTRIHEGVSLGAVFADRSRVEGGATVLSGTLVGSDAHVAAGSRVSGTVADGGEYLG